jgi:hypothetical protein
MGKAPRPWAKSLSSDLCLPRYVSGIKTLLAYLLARYRFQSQRIKQDANAALNFQREKIMAECSIPRGVAR